MKSRVFLLGLSLFALPAHGEVTEASVPVTVVAFGGYCTAKTDEQLKAPGTSKGQIGHNHHGFEYVVRGDRLKASPSLGLGVRMKLGKTAPGDAVVMKIAYPDGFLSHWNATVAANGEVEIGSDPAPGKTMMTGSYKFVVFRHDSHLVTFEMVFDGRKKEGPCAIQVIS